MFKWSNFGQIEIAKRQSREMSGTQADVNAFARLDISGAKKNLIDLFLEHLRMSVKDEKDLLSLLSRLFLFSYKTLNLDICLKLHFGLKSF